MNEIENRSAVREKIGIINAFIVEGKCYRLNKSCVISCKIPIAKYFTNVDNNSMQISINAVVYELVDTFIIELLRNLAS